MRAFICAVLTISTLFSQQLDTTQSRLNAVTHRATTDSIVVARARDSVVFDPSTQRLWLYGNAQLNHKNQALEAAIIEIDFRTKTLRASWAYDSTGRRRGYPILTDAGKRYAGDI